MNGLTILVVTISRAVRAKGKIVWDVGVLVLSAPFERSMGVTKSKAFLNHREYTIIYVYAVE
jgi:hypothetical protein